MRNAVLDALVVVSRLGLRTVLQGDEAQDMLSHLRLPLQTSLKRRCLCLSLIFEPLSLTDSQLQDFNLLL